MTITLTAEKSLKLGRNTVPVPCGKCLTCKSKRVSQWGIRLQKELEVSTSSYFVTLTYNSDHVPISGNGFMTLLKNSKKDKELRLLEITDDEEQSQAVIDRTDRSAQAFFKRLRYNEEKNRVLFDRQIKKVVEHKPIKYYACGEYGTLRRRPHIHIILFNVVDINSIYHAWATAIVEKGVTIDYVPFGAIDIDPDVNENNIAYVLKYIQKDCWNKMHKNDDRIKEFSLMSKGLGRNFITPVIEEFYNKRLDINYVLNKKGHKIPMPRYYRDKMMSEATKEDSAIVIGNKVEEDRLKKEKEAMLKGIDLMHLDLIQRRTKQALQKNYSKRNVD